MTRSLTGLNLVEFETLLPTFEKVLLEIQSSKDRQRAVGGGCKGILHDSKHKLFYILFYMKNYPTFDIAAFIFGTVRVTFEWKSKLLPALERALGRVVTLPKRQIRSVEEFLQLFPDVRDVFIEGTERPVQRPRKSKGLRRKYSGKKKRHPQKNAVFCDENSGVLVVSPSKDGRIHDSRQMRNALWMEKAYPKYIAQNGNAVMIPHKKPRKKAENLACEWW
jgi:hypothetical protein